MKETNLSSYYALVWNTMLSAKEEVLIKGKLICRNTVLPNDPRILYGNNPNDVAKIKRTATWREVKYDMFTAKESVKFWTEIDEYTLSRDVRVIVWEGEDTLCLPEDKYRTVSIETFGQLTKLAPVSRDVDNDYLKEWNVYINPIESLKYKFFGSIKPDEVSNSYEVAKGLSIKVVSLIKESKEVVPINKDIH